MDNRPSSNLASTAPHVNWRNALLSPNATLQQAIKNLDETAMQVVLVVSSDDSLLGTITDGDIRRALLRGLEMSSSIEAIMHPEPLVVPPEISREIVLQLMHVNKIHQLNSNTDTRILIKIVQLKVL